MGRGVAPEWPSLHLLSVHGAPGSVPHLWRPFVLLPPAHLLRVPKSLVQTVGDARWPPGLSAAVAGPPWLPGPVAQSSRAQRTRARPRGPAVVADPCLCPLLLGASEDGVLSGPLRCCERLPGLRASGPGPFRCSASVDFLGFTAILRGAPLARYR